MFRLFFGCVVILILTLSQGCTVTVEEAKYTVLEQDKNCELREYAPQIIAETVIDGSLEDAGNKAFNILYRYISGNNKAQNEIAMTAPVVQESASAKIAMTSPVIQEKSGNQWAVAFTMPDSYTMKTVPEPIDSRVKIRQIPARKMAAIRYSGRWTRELYENNLEKLNSWITQKEFIIEGEPLWARYNPPFTLWFLRRNEILLPVRVKDGQTEPAK